MFCYANFLDIYFNNIYFNSMTWKKQTLLATLLKHAKTSNASLKSGIETVQGHSALRQ